MMNIKTKLSTSTNINRPNILLLSKFSVKRTPMHVSEIDPVSYSTVYQCAKKKKNTFYSPFYLLFAEMKPFFKFPVSFLSRKNKIKNIYLSIKTRRVDMYTFTFGTME